MELGETSKAPAATRVEVAVTPALTPQDLVVVAVTPRELPEFDKLLRAMRAEADIREALKKSDVVRRIMAKGAEIRGLPPGTYFAHLFAVYQAETDGKRETRREYLSRKFTVGAGATAKVEFTLVADQTNVQLYVRSGGNPLAGAEVTVETYPNALVTKADRPLVLHLSPGSYAVRVRSTAGLSEAVLDVPAAKSHDFHLDVAETLVSKDPVAAPRRALDRTVYGGLRTSKDFVVRELRAVSMVPGEGEAAALAAIRAAMKADIPGLIAVHDVHQRSGSIWIQEEIFEHKPLSALMQAGALTPAHVPFVLGQVARTLAQCHAQRLVHGSIQAFDVLVGKKNAVKLADLGCVYMLLDAPPTAEKLELLSPEQREGRSPTPRSDAWHLGRLAFQMMTRRRLEAGDDAGLRREIARAKESLAVAAYPPTLVAWVQAALDPDPARRSTPDALLAALGQA